VGPNPTDRAKPGVKKSLLVEADGGPLAITIAGANVPDAQLLDATIEAVVLERPEPEPDFEQHLCLDKAYDNDTGWGACIDHGYTPHIALIRDERPARPKTYKPRRWVVEIILSQLTKPCVEAAFGGRDRVADLHVVIGDHHAIDQELDQFAALLEGGVLQALAESGADLGHGRQDLGRVQQPLSLRKELPLPCGKLGHAVGEPSLPLLERGQVQQPCHVRVEQPFLPPLEALVRGPDAGVLLLNGLG
jgi:hypothetical protein